jgi:hypothetical protein
MPARVTEPQRHATRPLLLARIGGLLDRLPLHALESLEHVLRAEAGAAVARAGLGISIQELRLLNHFRCLPDDERRQSVLEAFGVMGSIYG